MALMSPLKHVLWRFSVDSRADLADRLCRFGADEDANEAAALEGIKTSGQ